MQNTISNLPVPINEPVFSYAPGTPERDKLQDELKRLAAETVDIPIIIGGKEIRTGDTRPCIQPHDHSKILGHYHNAGVKEVEMAIEACMAAKKEWDNMP